MTPEEIRVHKGQALLAYQEAEDRVYSLRHELLRLAGTIEEFARLLNPGKETSRPPNLNDLQAESFKEALNHEAAITLASQFGEALQSLADATRQKQEFKLR